MDVNKLQFPLTRLPDNALQCFLRIADLPQLIGISLLSKKCKHLVESLNLGLTRMTVFIHYLTFYSENQFQREGVYQGPLYKPFSIVLNQYENEIKYKWENKNFEMKDWVNHLKAIFHRARFQELSVSVGVFELQSILEHFTNFDMMSLDVLFDDTINQYQNIVMHVHKPKQLFIEARLFPHNKVPKSIFLQNLDDLEIGGGEILELNDLLACGSKNLGLQGMKITGKELNRFIKLWMKGSNPRMESLRGLIEKDEDNITFEILKGLNAQRMTPGKQRLFKSASENKPYQVTKGLDIMRQDGTKATIMIDFFLNYMNFNMFIWHPQCVADSPV